VLIEITRGLNERLVPGPSNKKWVKTSLHGILTNEVYTGTAVWGKSSKQGLPPVRVEDAYPAIVSWEVFDRVRTMLGERAPAKVNPRRIASRFLLSGLVRCSYCGKGLCSRDAKGGKFSYYACTTKDKQGPSACPSVYYNSRKLEGLIVDRIRGLILTEENLPQLISLVKEQVNADTIEYQE
jgi:site-specific DNA recombinase